MFIVVNTSIKQKKNPLKKPLHSATEITFLSQCFQELSKITYKDDLSSYLARNKLSDITEFKPPPELEKQISSLTMANGFANSNGNSNNNTETGEGTIIISN